MSAAEATPPRGRDAVREALIEAAAEMLGELGPRNISVRELAERAGVNHGQVHHYFGGKRGLLIAAIRWLAERHLATSLEAARGDPIPPPLSMSDDRPYFRALCQSVMDGDLDLVMSVDADEHLSVPKRALRSLRERHPEHPDFDLRVRFAVFAAMQLGWVAFEELLLRNAEVAPDEADAFRAEVKRTMQRLIREAMPP
jgi:AcrR family transcriptional regulator